MLATSAAIAQDAAPTLGTPTWIEDPSGEALPRLHRALRRVKSDDGVARITIWGASHVASDQFTRVVRDRLQRRFGDAGHGLVPVGVPFALYEHADLELRTGPEWHTRVVRGRHRAPDAYGRAGFALETRARTSARIHPRARSGRGSQIASVEIWALAQRGGGSVELRVDGQTRARLSTRAAESAPSFAGARVPLGYHDLTLHTDGTGPVRLFGVALETGEPGIVVEAFGVPGARARDRLPWDDDLLHAHLARRPPDLAILAYGTNESGNGPLDAIERDLREAIRRTRAAAPDAACIIIGPSDWPERSSNGWRPRRRTQETNAIYRRTALAGRCGFFDLLHFQGGAGASTHWVRAGLMLDDHVHMTDEGYARLGHALARALLRGYE